MNYKEKNNHSLLLTTSALYFCSISVCAALPQGSVVAQGAVDITASGATTTVAQGSDRAVVDWKSFDVMPGESVNFNQPSANSAILNRIHDVKASDIEGTLTANGQVYLVNPNGMVFGKGSHVDVAGLIATTANISDADFMGGSLHFDTPGNAEASITNQGTITAREAGLVALVAPNVSNEGTIVAHAGRVSLSGADTMTLDLYGDDLLHIAVTKNSHHLAVHNTGTIKAQNIVLSAADASHLLSSVVNTDGVVEATTAQTDALGGIVLGGEVHVAAPFVSLGGEVTANGHDGGTVDVRAHSVSLADTIAAKGKGGKGGTVDIRADGLSMESSTSVIDVSGTRGGGLIHNEAGKGLITSGHYDATSTHGAGGNIDVTADTLVSLSASFDASGNTHGGRVRIGGEYQGGKNLAVDELKNAQTVSLNNATTIKAGGKGVSASGGQAVIWSDQKTIMAGSVDVSPSFIGAGGKVEISSADTLLYGGRVNTGRGGDLLFDPKNITIGAVSGTSTFSSVYSIFGANYSGNKNKDVSLTDALDYFGYSVSLDGTRLAIGAQGDDGMNDATPSAGAVYLFSFADTSFSSATLEGIIGKDYTGGKNVDVSSLEANDDFGSSVSLDGTRLAVGAQGDDGDGNALSDAGAVYLYSFVDNTFNGATQEAILGSGYTGGKNVNVTALGAGDYFGSGISLDGNRLAVGAQYDDGSGNTLGNSGAVHLFSFSDAVFSGGALEATIGNNYTGGKNYNLALGGSDYFGASISLDGNRLAVGATYDDGSGNALTNSGAVYLFSFSDAAFSNPTLQATLGKGYAGGKNYDLAQLDASDYFGWSTSLNGNRLAVGAVGDDGFGNPLSSSGAVYLFSFSDAAFSSPTLQATLGKGYASGKNLDVSTLASSDYFGSAVSLDGNNLAVGAYGDDGSNDLATDTGQVSIYSFTDSIFSGGKRLAILGKGYNSGGQTPLTVATSAGADLYGSSVSLDGTQLAVGAQGDDGFGNSTYDSGAVYLFTFADTTFKDITLQAILGKGYTGGKNINISTLSTSDYFGSSVSLDGNRLAVGSPGHDGNMGAAYLFSFTDAAFSGGTLQATIGKGYTGGKNINVTALDANDQFGSGVSLNGNRLAVGAQYDDGSGNTVSNSGAVYLFSFTDAAFNGSALQATLGNNYAGGKNYNLALGSSDYFGGSLSLDGNRLAVGTLNDDGSGNTLTNAGAAYLFSFSDAAFSSPTLQATLGTGYTGGKNINITALDGGDLFGASISLDGNSLAIGAYGDDGFGETHPNSGAIYLFSFSDAVFSGGTLQGRMGYGYTGGKNVNMSTLNSYDQMGHGLALDNNRLATGVIYGDGSRNLYTDTGSVYLFSFSDAVFSNGQRLNQIGKEYNGGPQLATPAITSDADGFGSAASLDGTRLAVGAQGDDGFGNTDSNSGAVYLFSFTDAAFNGGALQATIGKGYTGGKNVNLDSLQPGDAFGYGVSLDGNRLAVGAPNQNYYYGATYLFTFTDAAFNGGALAATIGKGYTGSKDVDLAPLSYNDRLGSAVSLDGNRLAVGAQYDDGSGNAQGDSGAVYLFSFSDAVFSNPTLQSTIGKGYTGGKNVNVTTLDTADLFGSAVSLNGNRLAVGAYGDDGSGNTVSGSGSAYLFTFSDAAFNGGALQATIGNSYTGGKNYNLALGVNDYFGYALSLDGNRLAVGARYDDGSGNVLGDSGAVHLFSFSDAVFSSPTLQSTIGKGYTGGKNYNLTLNGSDYFGWAVSLDGNRLAVGAYADDGNNNNYANDTGAVYLFSFSDAVFSSPTLEGLIGYDYTGGKNVTVPTLSSYDYFSKAISLDGTRLAVSVPLSDAADNSVQYAGSVYLFNFTDTNFHGGALQSTIGKGYTGGKNYNLPLETGDQFGTSVSLDGNRLAVGAIGDDGSGNTVSSSGAVYLFSFADAAFSTPTLEATIGRSYAGGKNYDVTVGGTDYFGSAVSLDGNRLAVGAQYDDGLGNALGNSGAVYLFSFSNATFSNPTLEATIGKGYTGGKNYDLTTLDTSDYLGSSVSLDGNRLAVGAYADDGSGNAFTDAGAVYLFSFSDAAFSTPTLEATIGKGYTGGKNIDLSQLAASDQFGISTSLSGNALAVGAPYDDGAGESSPDFGATYLFSFTNAAFGGGTLAGTLGANYRLGKNIGISNYGNSDHFGYSVALDGTRLAVGAYGDDGYADLAPNTGAVYLFSFTDTAFSGGKLLLTMGPGYTYGGELPITNTESYSYLGTAISLDGTRLAIGAPYDNGFNNTDANTGAVYLFSFSDTSFNNGTLQSTIGKDYAGGKNINVDTLVSGDLFGTSISLDGNRLAVGAPGTAYGSGAVYLYTFTDAAFSGGSLQATLGNGYTGGKNVDVSNLEYQDQFGFAVSLNGNRLAVGAPYDDGLGVSPQISSLQKGAVYLFSFADAAFTGGTQESIMGDGYTGGKNYNLTLGNSDYFGWSLSLDDNRLAIGARLDDGLSNVLGDSGAVYLFSFADAAFNGTTLEAMIGKGYTGGKNLDLSQLDGSDCFGWAVSLDGNRLAVGSGRGDGFGNAWTDSGEVYLFTFSDAFFNGGALASTMGHGYIGGKNLDLAQLTASDTFGESVSLDGNRLAVGASRDDGYDNSLYESGAVYLFSFADAAFSTPNLLRTIGAGYSQGVEIPVTGSENNSQFGYAVSLDGNRMVIGAPTDDGFGDAKADSGAVYLFSFANDVLDGGTLEGMIGNGFSGGKNVNVSGISAKDMFGSAVSLDGNRLAVGAQGDTNSAGAVYLFSFANSTFSGGTQEAILGSNYSGGKNFMVSNLGNSDMFGHAVSLDGNRLAVGAYGDDASGNLQGDSGAVYLFSFSDASFSNPTLEATMGKGYTGGKNVDLSQLGGSDQFGSAVSLDGNRLAVGSWRDDGSGNVLGDSGAVYLFSFTDAVFSGEVLESTIGKGYAGGKNIDSALLGGSDLFGSAVSLSGNRLAIGAYLDDGNANARTNSGATYLYSFTDAAFNGGTQEAIIGYNYTGGKNVNLSALEANDNFGYSVSLDGTHLAVGAPFDDGASNVATDSGAVYILSEAGDAVANGGAFATAVAASITITPNELTSLLDAGTNVTLQASNDITVTDPIVANNISGNGGNLFLQAGRSLLLNAGITTDNGNLSLTANETVAHGVVDAQRDAGAAVITFASGVSVNAGTGNVSLELLNGAGKTFADAGDITLGSITANTIFTRNYNASGNIVLGSGAALNTAGAGTNLTLVSAHNFVNNAGATPLNPGAGRSLVYSTDPAADTLGGLSRNFKRYSCTYGGACPAFPATGNGFLYSLSPTVTVTADDKSRQIGLGNPVLTASYSGYIDGDSFASVFTGAPALSTLAGAGSPVGAYAITSAAGTLTNALGYNQSYADGTLTVTTPPPGGGSPPVVIVSVEPPVVPTTPTPHPTPTPPLPVPPPAAGDTGTGSESSPVPAIASNNIPRLLDSAMLTIQQREEEHVANKVWNANYQDNTDSLQSLITYSADLLELLGCNSSQDSNCSDLK